MNRAWITLGSVATVVALAFGTFNTIGLLAHEELTERTTFDAAAIDRIDVDNEHGSIVIDGGDVDEVTLVAEISHGLRRTGHRIEVDDSTLVVRSSCPELTVWCRVDYRLVVPVDVAVDARSDNGRLAVRDIEGDVAVAGDNGEIDLDRLAGDVRADTDNGSVEATGLRSPNVTAESHNGRVTVSFVAPPTSVDASTHNGRVDVILPEGPAAYRVRADTDNGRTDIGVRTDPTSDRTVTARSNNGSVTVRYPTG